MAHCASTLVPPIPGVYAYAETQSVSGLPVEFQWVYVGQTKNLQRRLADHEGFADTNVELVRWLRSSMAAEVWYAPVGQYSLSVAEKYLIIELKPKFNRIKFNGGNGNEQ